MVGLWLAYGWLMVGLWLAYGWLMVGLWWAGVKFHAQNKGIVQFLCFAQNECLVKCSKAKLKAH